MRDIKFRLWNNAGDFSQYFYEADQVMDCLKQQCCYNQNPENKIGYNHIGDGSVFEQYTGLKDKNGVEIYEGDILKVCNNNNGFFEVLFINAFVGGWVLKYKDEPFLSLGARREKDIEVIGNIHQNPELL